MRCDNIGIVRIHIGEVPADLHDRLHVDDVKAELQATVLADQVLSLEKSLAESDTQRARLQELVIKQGAAISRYSELVDEQQGNAGARAVDTTFIAPSDELSVVSQNLAQRNLEVDKLKNILERTFKAIDARDQQVATEKGQLTRTADKAIHMLERAVREGELSTKQLHNLNQQISSSTNTSARLEGELDERNTVINNQNSLMERLVAIAEQSVAGTTASKPRKRSIWQRLFGGGKGI